MIDLKRDDTHPNDVLRGAVTKAYVEGIPKSPYVGLRTEAGGLPRGTRGLHRMDSRMNARSTGRDPSSSNVGTTSVHGEMKSA